MSRQMVARLAGALLAVAAAFGFAASAVAQEKKIKIGVIYDLTGPLAGGGSELQYIGAKIMIVAENSDVPIEKLRTVFQGTRIFTREQKFVRIDK